MAIDQCGEQTAIKIMENVLNIVAAATQIKPESMRGRANEKEHSAFLSLPYHYGWTPTKNFTLQTWTAFFTRARTLHLVAYKVQPAGVGPVNLNFTETGRKSGMITTSSQGEKT